MSTLREGAVGGAAGGEAHGEVVTRYAFGLDIASCHPFTGRPRAVRNGGAPSTVIEETTPAELARIWPARGSVLLMERRQPSGRPFLTVERHPDVGYRVSAPRYGDYIVLEEGRRVLASVPAVSGWRWQRLLFSQVLPLASALQGFALFHASAVAIHGRGYAFVAASGTGKTSLAAHLLPRGATLLTDDVLALDAGPEGVRAHPGAGMLAVHENELRVLRWKERAALGQVIGWAGKTYFACDPAPAPVPLTALYYLQRGPAVSRLTIAPRPPDPRLLLSSAFLGHLATGDHLNAHLEVCGEIAGSVPVFDLAVPPGVGAPEAAERVHEHMATLRRERAH